MFKTALRLGRPLRRPVLGAALGLAAATVAFPMWHQPPAVRNEPATPSERKEESPEAGNESQEAGDEPQAAFNPETGEINWDCPCLGGMAQGPCGEEFKAAFLCFVYSETEPKGIDCIKKFEGMRECFRQHPEHYKEELYEDDEVPAVEAPTAEPVAEAPVEPVEPVAEAVVPDVALAVTESLE